MSSFIEAMPCAASHPSSVLDDDMPAGTRVGKRAEDDDTREPRVAGRRAERGDRASPRTRRGPARAELARAEAVVGGWGLLKTLEEAVAAAPTPSIMWRQLLRCTSLRSSRPASQGFGSAQP
jgi:hypothetical protein